MVDWREAVDGYRYEWADGEVGRPEVKWVDWGRKFVLPNHLRILVPVRVKGSRFLTPIPDPNCPFLCTCTIWPCSRPPSANPGPIFTFSVKNEEFGHAAGLKQILI